MFARNAVFRPVPRLCIVFLAYTALHTPVIRKNDDMNVDVPVADARRIEVVANGLPLWHGSQLALDGTIVSPLTRLGEAHPRADVEPGCAVNAAARRKRHQTYPELAHARRRCRHRGWRQVRHRDGRATPGRVCPRPSRPATITAWVACWSALLAVAAQRALAASLLELPPAEGLGDGPVPDLHEVLADALRLGWLRSPWIAPLVAAPRNSYRRGHSGQVQKNDGATYCFCRLLELFH